MAQGEDSFLRHNNKKREIAKRALLKAASSEDWLSRSGAIGALRYFPDAEVFTLLKTISLTDSATV